MGETFALDERPSGPGKLEPSVQHKMSMENRAQKAIFGYARLDVIKNKEEFLFGTWNERPLKPGQVSRLVQSFLTKGADRFSYTKAIPLVLKKSDVKEGTYAKTYTPGIDAVLDLPILALEDGKKGKKKLVAAGGQHRVRAVEEWTKILNKQHSELELEREMLEQQDSEAVTSTEIWNENEQQKPKRDVLQETLALGGQWMVVLYDRGEFFHRVLT